MIPLNNEIRFEVTTKCNYSCLICPREKLTRKLETMDFNKFKFLLEKILDETDQYTVCTFSGFGEPLLDPGILEKIAYARKKGLTVLILTNASLLTPEMFKEFDNLGVSSIRVSFYGKSQYVYNKIHNIHQEDLFFKIKKNIVDICKIKQHTQIILTYNLVQEINSEDVEEWINYWEDKADLLEVWRPHNWVDGKNYRQVQASKEKTCGRPWKTPLQLQVDGTINMCCFDFDGKLTLGDLKTQSLNEIFSSGLINKLRECHTTGNFRNSGLICEHCDQRNKDKSSIMVYNSKFDVNERVGMVSTTYSKIV